MELFTKDSQKFEEFFQELEAMRGRLASLAPEGDRKELERLAMNFERKTEDFYRENRKLNIGVVGQVKAGKSSFLNTLLFGGREILPKASTPKTATLTKMEYSQTNRIQIEYYSVEEWEVLEDNALVDLEDEVYTSAREIVGMARRNGLEPFEFLEKGYEEIQFATYDDLIADLNNYVGEDGTFTPIVKAVTLYLNKEEFQGLSIVDTPGLNDPIASRTIRTKEFMEVCDVVFFLSQSGSFLDKSDWILLSSQLPQKGVKRLVLIGSKYDSGIRDILRVQDDDDVFGDDDNTADNIPKACKIMKRKLKKRAKSKVEEFVRDLSARESGAQLIEVIKQCSEPILVSSLACNMVGKSREEYNKEEQNIYAALKLFSEDLDKDLKLLGNFEEVNRIFSGVAEEKEEIFRQKARDFLPTVQEELHGLLEGFREKSAKRLLILEQNDKQQLLKQTNFMESQIGAVKADIAALFGELNSRLESEKANGVREIREISKDYLNIKERSGSRVVWNSYTVSDSKWFNPFSWGKSHVERSSATEHYSYLMASDAIDNLRRFSVDAMNQVEEVFSDAVELKEIKRRLLSVVVQNFDMGSESYDSSLFRIMVEETVRKIEFPVFHIDISDCMNGIAAKFTGELTSAGDRNELAGALSNALSRIYKELCHKLTTGVADFKEKMQTISGEVEDRLLENINQEFEMLLSQYEDKEKEIGGYTLYKEALEREIKRL